MSGDVMLSTKAAETVNTFLQTSDGVGVTNLYEMVIHEMELGLYRATMEYSEGNQSVATSILSISRATLRKKLKELDLLYHGKLQRA